MAKLAASPQPDVDGLVLVQGYRPYGRPPEEALMIEKARSYGAHSVFFEAGRNGRAPIAQAFVFISKDEADDAVFAELHKRLWSWGGVPLVYRKLRGMVQLFRCAHKADFITASGDLVCKPIKTLKIATKVSADPWWDETRLRNGTLWDDPEVCRLMLSASKSAHRRLVDAVKELHKDVLAEKLLDAALGRRLLILSLLIAYLEERGVLLPDFFAKFLPGAQRFFEVLANGQALVEMLAALEDRFNGHVFSLKPGEQNSLRTSQQLARFATLIEAHEEAGGQLTLWQLYSFKDLPVELISHIYQLFVKDVNSSVYTPPSLVRLILEEALSWERLDRLIARGDVILDPACGSGVFLVEAYKRLVLHWRTRNEWQKPDVEDLKGLLKFVHGVDLEEGAIELAAFSLCLALCDALEPEEIRASVKLFPPLAGETLHHSCFFDAKDEALIKANVGVVVGNPPFVSKLTTPGAVRAYQRYVETHGPLPDKQLAYLFLHEAMQLVCEDGILSMLQQDGFLYNRNSLGFRKNFFETWNVREILDFVSVRGLFQKGGADTKIVVVVAVAQPTPPGSKILHAVFRRNGRADAEQGFDIDYYDLHWLPHELVLQNDGVWRADLLGGGRTLAFVDRLKSFPTLGEYAERQKWTYGEGFIEGNQGISRKAAHIVGKNLLPSGALGSKGIDVSMLETVPEKPIEGPRSQANFTPPFLVVRKQEDLHHDMWTESYLTFKNEIVGFAGNKDQRAELSKVNDWLSSRSSELRAFVALSSLRLFTKKATAIAGADILSLPYMPDGSLEISDNEIVLANDIVAYQRDLIRLGDASAAFKEKADGALTDFAALYCSQINTVYEDEPLRPLKPYIWPGVVCQPFAFGDGEVDWTGAEELRGKIDLLLREQRGSGLSITRIARIYDDRFVFFLKPDRLRYWLRSVALRDADETLADLRMQGF
ncbi:HsdM family class I SAM-dependent methyltransferase (plasmid) [Agrobacterium rosae]|uniref:HsdM family class I SAM-dependent methyltransferase n=1 Tax=Agrobacterium rosae TaxID=1972867 RepID=UPI002A12B7C9|nr:N-6 DNA methylase [Agrobacterium rosae]MDX8316107.1 N-6 DNA methylase [Agrobacterium rosae]